MIQRFKAFLNRNATYLSTVIAVIAVIAAIISTTAILRTTSLPAPPTITEQLNPEQGWRKETSEKLDELPQKIVEAIKEKSPAEVERLLKQYNKTKPTEK